MSETDVPGRRREGRPGGTTGGTAGGEGASRTGPTPPRPYSTPRHDERITLDERLRRLTRLTLAHVDGSAREESVPTGAELVDFSRVGFRFRASRGYNPGTRLACRLTLTTVEAESLGFDAEVRWCIRLGEREYEGGVRILGGAPGARLVVFERFLQYHRARPSGDDPAG